MILNKTTLLLAALIFLMPSSGCKKYEGKIVFSCIFCHGCVENAFHYIENKHLDERYQIILDTTCFQDMLNTTKMKYTPMSKTEIQKEYGEFGNYLLITNGNKTEFKTDMDLSQFLQ